jgi:dihydrofolate reductase
MPWYYPEDLRHFKETTLGHPVVMGRVTYDSIVEMTGGPLPDRLNIVLSHSLDSPEEENVVIADSLDDALSIAEETSSHDVFIAGGASVYEQAFPYATRLVITEIPDSPDGDTYFPDWDDSKWALSDQRTDGELTFVTYHK